MDPICDNCPHLERDHYVQKDESVTGCMFCICHAYRDAVVPELDAVVPEFTVDAGDAEERPKRE